MEWTEPGSFRQNKTDEEIPGVFEHVVFLGDLHVHLSKLFPSFQLSRDPLSRNWTHYHGVCRYAIFRLTGAIFSKPCHKNYSTTPIFSQHFFSSSFSGPPEGNHPIFREIISFLQGSNFLFIRSIQEIIPFSGPPISRSSWQVKEWQQQLLQQLGAETCERLRQRGVRRMGQEKRKVKVAKEVQGGMGMNIK